MYPRQDVYNILQEQERYVTKLDIRNKEALSWYTGGGFDKFNEYIRKNRVLSKEYTNILLSIDEAFDNVQATQNVLTVYKGIEGSNVFNTDKTFVSTTVNYNRTKRFSGRNCCVLQITVSPGSKALPIRSISREPDEEEVLLDRDAKFQVTGETINEFDMKVIFVTYIPKGSVAIESKQDLIKAEKYFDHDLIIQRVADFLKNEDPDFVDDEEISLIYKKITTQKITAEDLQKIKLRLAT